MEVEEDSKANITSEMNESSENVWNEIGSIIEDETAVDKSENIKVEKKAADQEAEEENEEEEEKEEESAAIPKSKNKAVRGRGGKAKRGGK